jgi:hypothetical protein
LSFRYLDISYNDRYLRNMFVWLFIATWAIFQSSSGCYIPLGLHVCLALMAFGSEGSFTCHICNTGPQFIILVIWGIGSHVPQWDSNPTWPSYLYTAALTAAARRLNNTSESVIRKYSLTLILQTPILYHRYWSMSKWFGSPNHLL